MKPSHRHRMLLRLAIAASVVLIGAEPSRSHDWYEKWCCHDQDCRPISGIRDGVPWSEIEDMGDHYEWRSTTSGKTHIIRKDATRPYCIPETAGAYNYNCAPRSVLLPSQDGFFHGCESMPNGPAQGSTPYCIFLPLSF